MERFRHFKNVPIFIRTFTPTASLSPSEMMIYKIHVWIFHEFLSCCFPSQFLVFSRPSTVYPSLLPSTFTSIFQKVSGSYQQSPLLFHLVKQYKRTLIATYGDLALEITPLNGPEFEVTGKVWGGSKHPFCDTGGVVCMVTEIEAGRSVGGGGELKLQTD